MKSVIKSMLISGQSWTYLHVLPAGHIAHYAGGHYSEIINDPRNIPLPPLCNISNIAAMHQNINVEAAEVVDVIQRTNTQ